MRLRGARSFITLLICLPLMAQAQETPAALSTSEVGNLPADFYPPSPCVKPRKKPQFSDGMAENVRYNREVTLFNPCIASYLENAKRDVAYILAVVNAAAEDGASVPVPAGPGNLPPGSYPRHACIKPDKAAVGQQPGIRDKAMAAYNERASQFNAQAAAYNLCIAAYVANARRDIAHMQATLDAAVPPPATLDNKSSKPAPP